MANKRILIVGGVAGGASCAARARRLSETAEITIFERGPYVSFANCGLPYYVGNVIKEETDLLVASAELFKRRFNIEVRLENEVLSIDRSRQVIKVRDLKNGKIYEEGYDALVLAPGARPIRPPLPGIDLPGIFALRTIPDSRQIRQWIVDRKPDSAVVIGCGFIGLEMAENLVERGLSVQMIDMAPQVLPPLDPEMATLVREHLEEKDVCVHLNDPVSGFEAVGPDGLKVFTQSGAVFESELVILGIGIRPENRLALDAGLELGETGGIHVNEHMQTSDPHIWAVGDAVEVRDFVTGEYGLVPLAGPANRQGRIAADVILGRDSRFRGVQGTAVCSVFGQVAAVTGANEKTLMGLQRDYAKVYLHPGHHVGYFPGARAISNKLLFDAHNGRILGMQAVGKAGVERRVDVVALGIQQGATVFDLEEAELCYAPQFGAAKDPVNMAGMVAANALRGDNPLAYWEDLEDSNEVCLLDVRDHDEFEAGHISGAINIPLNTLRERLGELPKEGDIFVYCQVGQRAYYALRVLKLNGLDAKTLRVGWLQEGLWLAGPWTKPNSRLDIEWPS